MSKVLMCSVYDKAACAFLQPFFVPNLLVATRSVKALVNEEGHQFNKHAEDYCLYVHCAFDDESGSIDDVHELPKFVLNLPSLIEVQSDLQTEESPKSYLGGDSVNVSGEDNGTYA